jgi:hypothetical protein
METDYKVTEVPPKEKVAELKLKAEEFMVQIDDLLVKS